MQSPNRHKVAKFEILRTGFIDAAGKTVAPLPAFARDRATLVSLYRGLMRTRLFDEKAIALQRTGRLGTFASSLGQEAVMVGLASAMRPEDVLLPAFRDHGAQLWRGVTMREIFLYWGGDERGSDFAGPRDDFPVCIPVATHLPHAAGVAMAFKLRGEPRAAVCVLGDGATSKGDFYEGLNVIGAWRLPVVVVINNNQWAISVPRREQTAAETLAQKAIAAGLPGEQTDGNDVIAVREAVENALARARAGEGGCVIEALSYRLCDHTTADDATRYRSDEEVSAHWAAEPIARLRAFLVSDANWSKTEEEGLLTELRREVDAEAEAYLATPPENPSAMFDYLYQELPTALAAQRKALCESTRKAEGKGDA